MLEQLLNFNFLSKATSFSIPDILVALFISFVLGLFIYFVYLRTYRGVMHSSAFGITLIAMDLITTLVIMAVTSNLITSLGMVGALSIVRFRVYLFWAITTGIIVGAGLIPLALIGSLVIGLVLVVFVNHKTNDIPYVVVIGCGDEQAEQQAISLLHGQTKKHIIKAKTVSNEGIELSVEVRLKGSSSQFVNDLLAIDQVSSATLVSYNGDYYM